MLGKDPRATLADVAKGAGVGRATLHRYFASREELVSVLALESIQAIDEACAAIDYYGQSPTVSLRQTLEVTVPLGARYAFLAYQATFDEEVMRELSRQHDETRQLVEAVKSEGTFDAEIPTSWIVTTIDHLIYAGWSAVQAGTPAPQVVDLMMRTLTRGLGTGQAP